MVHGGRTDRSWAEADLADFAADAGRRRAVEPPGPQPVAGPLVAALNRLCDGLRPEAHRVKLRDWVLAEIADPDMNESVAGRAADAVVFDGLPERELAAVVDAVKLKDRTGKIKKSRGAAFQFLLREACGRCGVTLRGARRIPARATDHE